MGKKPQRGSHGIGDTDSIETYYALNDIYSWTLQMAQNRRQYDGQIKEVYDEVCEVKQEVTALKDRFDLREPQFLQSLEDTNEDRIRLEEHIQTQDVKFNKVIESVERVSKSVDNNTTQMATVGTTLEMLHKETRQSVAIANRATGFWEVTTWLVKFAGMVLMVGSAVVAGVVYVLTHLEELGVFIQ